MRDKNSLNLNSSQAETRNEMKPESPSEAGKHAGSPAGSNHRMNRQDRGARSLRRGVRALWVSLAVLVIATVGAGIWSYERIQEAGDVALSEYLDLHALVETLENRVASIESVRLDDKGFVEGLAGRIEDVELSVKSGFNAVRVQVRDMAQEIAREFDAQLKADVDRQVATVDRRVDAIGLVQEGSSERLAALEDELRYLRLETRRDLAELRRSNALEVQTMVQTIGERISNTEQGLNAVAYQIERTRFDFELYEDDPEELTPGIRLHVSDTDVGRQEVDGWIHLMSEGRFIRIKDQPVRQAIVFHTQDDDRSYELSFTRATEDAAVGYFMIPSDGPSFRAERVGQADLEAAVLSR